MLSASACYHYRMSRKDKGILIAFEGIDGAGKTTQVKSLHAMLVRAGIDPHWSKEPTDGPWGRMIRDASKSGKRMTLEEEMEAFTKDRDDHVRSRVKPCLDAGKVYILDRYYYSTIAYQGTNGGDPEQLTRHMTATYPVPDVVIYIDVPAEIGIHRVQTSRGDVPNAFEKVETLRNVREIFLDLARTRPNFVTIDGTASIECVRADIRGKLIDGIFKERLCAKSYGCDGIHCIDAKTGNCKWSKIREEAANLTS